MRPLSALEASAAHGSEAAPQRHNAVAAALSALRLFWFHHSGGLALSFGLLKGFCKRGT